MRHGEFDSDTGALEQRILSHEKYGTNDLNEWIFSILKPGEGQSILDLGCGTGKQSIPLAETVGPEGRVIAMDVSQDAVDAVDRRARELGLQERIDTIRDSLDNLAGRVEGRRFDRVVASYSIYYVEDAERLFRTLADIMNPGAILFFCGPSSENNAEIIAFHNKVKGEAVGSAGTAQVFMEGDGARLTKEYLTGFEAHQFENPIRFDSADALVVYWSSYNLYDPAIEGAFREAAKAHFDGNETFQTTKRVIGISARKG
jgi:SAM-dependent methyltransferase